MDTLRYERWFKLDYRGKSYWVRAWSTEEALTFFQSWVAFPFETELISIRPPVSEDKLPEQLR